MRRFGLAALLCALVLAALPLAAGPAWADGFELPGVEADANAYENALTHRFPAGGTPQARRTADAQAAAAMQAKDWNAAMTALEQRIALGDAPAKAWMDLSTAALRRTPPDAKKALSAGWQAFSAAEAGAPEIAALLQMAEALKLLDRPTRVVQTLEAVVERAPADPNYKRMLADAQKAAGMLVRTVRTEGEADPPRVCISFTVAPVRRNDFAAQDWVKLEPAAPGAAVTREDDQICVSGLPSGMTTRLTLRAGLPADQGLALNKDTVLAVAMPNRKPRIVFDTRMFVLPRGQAPAATLTTVNLSAVSLKLIRMTERNVIAFLRETHFGEAMDRWSADRLAEEDGSVVWQGHADIPKWEANKSTRTALPFPDALLNAGPGLYALLVQPGDGTPDSSASAVQVIQRTDLAPTLWRGSDGLTVQVRGTGSAACV